MSESKRRPRLRNSEIRDSTTPATRGSSNTWQAGKHAPMSTATTAHVCIATPGPSSFFFSPPPHHTTPRYHHDLRFDSIRLQFNLPMMIPNSILSYIRELESKKCRDRPTGWYAGRRGACSRTCVITGHPLRRDPSNSYHRKRSISFKGRGVACGWRHTFTVILGHCNSPHTIAPTLD
jgi:hypothetical protein